MSASKNVFTGVMGVPQDLKECEPVVVEDNRALFEEAEKARKNAEKHRLQHERKIRAECMRTPDPASGSRRIVEQGNSIIGDAPENPQSDQHTPKTPVIDGSDIVQPDGGYLPRPFNQLISPKQLAKLAGVSSKWRISQRLKEKRLVPALRRGDPRNPFSTHLFVLEQVEELQRIEERKEWDGPREPAAPHLVPGAGLAPHLREEIELDEFYEGGPKRPKASKVLRGGPNGKASFTGYEAQVVYSYLDAGKSITNIVAERGLHPYVVRDLAVSYANDRKALFLKGDVVARIRALRLPLEGYSRLRATDDEQIARAFEALAEALRCRGCKGRVAKICSVCAKVAVHEARQEERNHRALEARDEDPTASTTGADESPETNEAPNKPLREDGVDDLCENEDP